MEWNIREEKTPWNLDPGYACVGTEHQCGLLYELLYKEYWIVSNNIQVPTLLFDKQINDRVSEMQYNNINIRVISTGIEILNFLCSEVNTGRTIFADILSER